MKKLTLLFSLGALLALGTSANALTIPISGTFSGTGTASGSFESFVGTGSDTTFGTISSATESATISVSGPNITLTNGNFEFDFTSGGSLIGTFSGSGASNSVAINFLITAGLLPGDTGSATGVGSFDSTTNQVSGSYSGNIIGPDGPDACVGIAGGLCVNQAGLIGPSPDDEPSPTPLPAALPLFASGIGAFGLLGWRRKKKFARLVA